MCRHKEKTVASKSRREASEGEAGSMREPDMGLDPRSPGSHPRLQAALNHCATGAALVHILNEITSLCLSPKHILTPIKGSAFHIVICSPLHIHTLLTQHSYTHSLSIYANPTRHTPCYLHTPQHTVPLQTPH